MKSKDYKNAVFTIILAVITIAVSAQVNDQKQIKAVVSAFADNADKQDAAAMKTVLHADFRAAVNRVFGSENVSIITKESYVQMNADKKIGGDTRKVSITSVDVQGNNAHVKATFTGEKLTFNTYLLFVKNPSSAWALISDMPDIAKN